MRQVEAVDAHSRLSLRRFGVVIGLAIATAICLGVIAQNAAAAPETVLKQDWTTGLKSEIPEPSHQDPLTGLSDQWLVYDGGGIGGAGEISEIGSDVPDTAATYTGYGDGTRVMGYPSGGKEASKDKPALDTRNMWHVQSNPQDISINPFISSRLIKLPTGDSGALPAPTSGSNVAWFGDPTSGTFCGTETEVETNPSNQTLNNGCETYNPGVPEGGEAPPGFQEGELVSPPFSLVGAESAVLHFNSWFEVEAVAAEAFDIMEVDYSTDEGATWSDAGTLNPANDTNGEESEDYTDEGQNTPASWQPILVDLSPARGQEHVRVRFVFDSKDSLFNGFRGWLIESVSVVTPSDAGTPAITSVDTCLGTSVAPVTVIHGNNFFVGSTVTVDGVAQAAQTPSSTRLEIPAIEAGTHTIEVLDPNGGAVSNVFTVNQPGTCVPAAVFVAPPAPGPAPPTRPPLPPPVLGKTVNVELVSGKVFVKLPTGTANAQTSFAFSPRVATESLSKGTGFVPLSEARQIPVGSILETTAGVARITTATATAGKTQFGNFGAGIFKLLQNRKEKGLTELDIMNAHSARTVCATLGKGHVVHTATTAAKHLSSKVLGRLNSSASGKFMTRGQYSSATVRGTIWDVSNRCDGTFTKVIRDVVSVRDFRRRKTITLLTGQSYLAKAPR